MSYFTATELADEAERELRYRMLLYSKMVNDGTMPKAMARRRIAMMEEIASMLRAKAAKATEKAL